MLYRKLTSTTSTIPFSTHESQMVLGDVVVVLQIPSKGDARRSSSKASFQCDSEHCICSTISSTRLLVRCAFVWSLNTLPLPLRDEGPLPFSPSRHAPSTVPPRSSRAPSTQGHRPSFSTLLYYTLFMSTPQQLRPVPFFLSFTTLKQQKKNRLCYVGFHFLSVGTEK